MRHAANIIAEMTREGYVRIARLASVGRRAEVVEALEQLETAPSEIAATLRSHHVSGMVRASLDEGSAAVCPKLLTALDAVRPLQLASADELASLFDDVRRCLGESDVPVLLLKGRYFADRLYAHDMPRPQFDVDVLVPSWQHRKARRELHRAGFERVAYDLHSQTLARHGLKVDLHRYLRWAPAYAINERAIWASAKTVRVGALEARTLSDDYSLVLLALSAFEDLGQGMAKLKQLLDIYLMLRQVDETIVWEAFFSARAGENVEGVLAAVFALVVALFDVVSEVPRLAAALAARGHSCDADERRAALELTFADRKAPASLAWFKRVYPGRLPLYLAWFWAGGFPANLRGPGTGRVGDTVRVAFGRASLP